MQDTTIAIADRVRGIAARHRANQTVIANLLGIQRGAVNQRMNGRVPFTAPEVFKLAQTFHEDVAEFYPSAVPASPAAPSSPEVDGSVGVRSLKAA